MKQYSAKLSYLRIAPRKVRMVADLVRGQGVVHAEQQLEFATKRPSYEVLKLLKSAVANAKTQDININEKDLYIKELRVDEGPKLKRYRAGSRGTAMPIEKKTSHITLILAEREAKKQSDSKAKKVKNTTTKAKPSIATVKPEEVKVASEK